MISGLYVMAITAPLWATGVIKLGGWRMGYCLLSGLVLALGISGLLIMRRDRSEPPVAPVAGGPARRTALRFGSEGLGITAHD
jgi:hypothetical protein